MTDRLLKVSEVAEHLRVSPKIVRMHIARKRLTAVNLGTGKRPTYRVAASAVAAFELRRSTLPEPSHRRRIMRQDSIVQFV